MWSVKFLSGPERGKEYLLPNGLIVLGRDKECQILILSEGVSKKHAQITVDDQGKLVITDLNSSNGVFLNGKQIHEKELKEGDRVGLYDVIFEVQKKNQKKYTALAKANHQNYPTNQLGAFNPEMDFQQAEKDGVQKTYKSFQKFMENYLHKVILPGVYKLAEWMDFKIVIAAFILIFVVTLTALSSVPLTQILKSSVEQESKNHAESIAKILAQINKKPLKDGLSAALNVNFALRRPGVKKALIINAVNGRIMAPAESAHLFPKESFIHRARKMDRSSVEKLDDSTIGAAVPISFYNAQTGDQTPTAYSVVIYDMGAFTVENKEIISLVFQNLFIAAILGLLLFFFLIHLIHFPIRSINHQLNQSLKGEIDSSSPVSTNYQSEEFNDLCQSINSVLNQMSLSKSANKERVGEQGIDMHRQNEMTNIVEIIGFPALSINLIDNTFAGLNSSFQEQFGMEEILHQPLDSIADSDFKDTLKGLLEQAQMNPEDISFGEIHLKEMELQTTCQFVRGADKPVFAIITFTANEEESA